MRTLTIVVFCILCIAGNSFAGPVTYIGLYSDCDHSVCRVDVPAAYLSFNVWIWVLPGDDGMSCVEFALDIPPHYLNTGTTLNPDHSIAIPGCSLPDDCIMCFPSCNYSWVWIARMNILPTEIHQDFISLTSTIYGYFDAAGCGPGYPSVPFAALNNLAVNRPCVISTNPCSWGMIKKLYSD